MSFGGWSFSVTCFNYIREKLAKGQTILELGSGWGTGELSKFYKMYSIENENSFINKYNSTYIHAPIKRYNSEFKAPDIPENIGWYDPDIIKLNLPKNYHLILVDGPNGRYGRGGFYTYLELFNTAVPIIFDDISRNPEKILMEKVSKKIGREFIILEDSVTGVILND